MSKITDEERLRRTKEIVRRGRDTRMIVGNKIVGYDGKALSNDQIEELIELTPEDQRNQVRLSIECNTAWDKYLKKLYSNEMFVEACEDAKERYIPGYKRDPQSQQRAKEQDEKLTDEWRSEHMKAILNALK